MDSGNHLLMSGAYRIIVVKPRPRMELSLNVPVTDEFRKWHNAWALEFFGVYYPIQPKQVLYDTEKSIMYVREDDYPRLSPAIAKYNSVS